ncbi:hypothetical protein R6G00_29880 [Streptomyces roseofulvus]|uniref:Major facilitator superfamily (MFS) profile domain-containing protein n=2 Tax=Streptomyces TaxID=1883 RepID=A0ABU4KGG4_9ACTN|nr:hypothetical protein [Streptomyces roseolus]MDX2296380.1 hypothetical protein [Streptomyces roseolus]
MTPRTLHRNCCVHAYVGVAVPVFGFAMARGLGVLGGTWLIVSMVLTAVAAGVLGLLVLPAQNRAVEGRRGPPRRPPLRHRPAPPCSPAPSLCCGPRSPS